MKVAISGIKDNVRTVPSVNRDKLDTKRNKLWRMIKGNYARKENLLV